MRAVVSTKMGAQLRDVATPTLKPNEILVRVKASALNRADLAALSAESQKVVGMEWAGEVTEVGPEVSKFRVGDRVMCTGSGGHAEYAVTDWGRACRIPQAMSFEDAAALPLGLQTMHDAVAVEGQFKPGDSVLIQGASSGVGLMALQIAKHLGAGVVFGTSTNPNRRKRLAEFGADFALDSQGLDWVQELMKETNGKGVDLIIDLISGPTVNLNFEVAALRGRIVNVGRLGGRTGTVDFNLHALKRLSYIGVTFRTRSVEEIRVLNAKALKALSSAIDAHLFRIPIDTVFPISEASVAFTRMKENAHFGKILLTP